MPLRPPRFRSESEEAAWWDQNLDRILEEGIAHLQSRQTLKKPEPWIRSVIPALPAVTEPGSMLPMKGVTGVTG